MPVASYRPPRHLMLMGGTAAVAAASALLIGLLALFDHAGPEHFLPPTSELMARLAQCEQQPARNAREQCTRELVRSVAVAGRPQQQRGVQWAGPPLAPPPGEATVRP